MNNITTDYSNAAKLSITSTPSDNTRVGIVKDSQNHTTE